MKAEVEWALSTLQPKLKLHALSKSVKISSCDLQLSRLERHCLSSEQQFSSPDPYLSSSDPERDRSELHLSNSKQQRSH